MKKLIAVSSLLALVVAGSGLFAFDILNSEGEASGFSLTMQSDLEFDIITDDSESHDNDKTWIAEHDWDDDNQAQIEIGVGYDGDNYAFGVSAGFKQEYAADPGDASWYLNDAWGKYYLMDKQFSIRGGGLAGDWGGTIWDTFDGSWSDDKPGVQLAFAPSALTGFSVGLSLPVPVAGTREIDDSTPTYGNWGPTYPLMNAVFGLRLNQTIPGLDFSTELKLNGNVSTNGKGAADADEGEGDFLGFDIHPVFKYIFAPVTLQLSLPVTGIASAIDNAPDPITKLAVQVTFDIPNAEGSSLDLGDPLILLKMLPNENVYETTAKESESFKDMFIRFEWQPGYSLSDEIKAFLRVRVDYKSWAEATTLQKDNPLEFSVRPRIQFKFAPNATLDFQDNIYFARLAKEKGFRNELGFRFQFGF